jgi:hypothetical protein
MKYSLLQKRLISGALILAISGAHGCVTAITPLQTVSIGAPLLTYMCATAIMPSGGGDDEEEKKEWMRRRRPELEK